MTRQVHFPLDFLHYYDEAFMLYDSVAYSKMQMLQK